MFLIFCFFIFVFQSLHIVVLVLSVAFSQRDIMCFCLFFCLPFFFSFPFYLWTYCFFLSPRIVFSSPFILLSKFSLAHNFPFFTHNLAVLSVFRPLPNDTSGHLDNLSYFITIGYIFTTLTAMMLIKTFFKYYFR